MAYVTVFNNIIFIEGQHPRAIKKHRVDMEMSGIGAQLKSLDNLKTHMVNIAKMRGCNCIVEFKYGQKSKFFAFDDVAYYADGYYAVLSPEDYNAIRSQFV